MIEGEKVRFCSSFRSEVFLELDYYFFPNFGMVLETDLKLYVVEPVFLKKYFCSENWENGPKAGFFDFIETFGH